MDDNKVTLDREVYDSMINVIDMAKVAVEELTKDNSDLREVIAQLRSILQDWGYYD